MRLFKSYILSIIIPCSNSSKTIKRLMDSIINQDIKKSKYEVIICNDKNEDNYLNIVSNYKKYLNLKIVNTNNDIHCPANTRQVGLNKAKGKYITFIDHDDEFVNDSLNKVINYLKNYKGNNPVIYTEFLKCKDNKELVMPYNQAFAFLHGKFYNKKFLDKNNIKFKENMKGYEDIYFNNLIMSKLYKKEIYEFNIVDITTYRWIYNSNSISNNDTKRGYLFDNFEDYIIAAAYPFINEINKINERQVLMTLVRTYYYYQAAISNSSKSKYKDTYKSIEKFLKDIKNNFNIDNEYIINYVNDTKEVVKIIEDECLNLFGDLKTKESFSNFIKKLN